MRDTITYRIPMYKLMGIKIEQDTLFQELIQHLIMDEVVLHDKEFDIDYVVKEVRVSTDFKTNEKVVELDVENLIITAEEFKESTKTIMQYLVDKCGEQMKEEKWITDIKNTIDDYVKWDITSIENLARIHDVEVDYVLERYRDRVVYSINKKLKGE